MWHIYNQWYKSVFRAEPLVCRIFQSCKNSKGRTERYKREVLLQKVKTVRERVSTGKKQGESMSTKFTEFVMEFLAKDPRRAGPVIVEEVEAVRL